MALNDVAWMGDTIPPRARHTDLASSGVSSVLGEGEDSKRPLKCDRGRGSLTSVHVPIDSRAESTMMSDNDRMNHVTLPLGSSFQSDVGVVRRLTRRHAPSAIGYQSLPSRRSLERSERGEGRGFPTGIIWTNPVSRLNQPISAGFSF